MLCLGLFNKLMENKMYVTEKRPHRMQDLGKISETYEQFFSTTKESSVKHNKTNRFDKVILRFFSVCLEKRVSNLKIVSYLE